MQQQKTETPELRSFQEWLEAQQIALAVLRQFQGQIDDILSGIHTRKSFETLVQELEARGVAQRLAKSHEKPKDAAPREPVTHELKTWPQYFDAVKRGDKTFEVRKADRDFRVRDTLILMEWRPEIECYTGREVARKISYVMEGGQHGLEEGFVVLGLEPDPCGESQRDKLQVLERELSILSTRVQMVEKHLKYGSPLTSEDAT